VVEGTVLELIVGAVLPPVIDLINKYIKHSRVRYIVSIIVCLLLGVAFNYQNLDFTNILASGAIIFAAAQTTYKTYWNTSKLRAVVTK